MNIYEIRIDENFIKNETLIENFLFDCQCALFLVDITNIISFNMIKELINKINLNKYPYLKEILVLNKLDLDNSRKISFSEVKDFLEKNKLIDKQEISIKNGDNINELIQNINNIENESKNKLPINLISKLNTKKLNISKNLNIILIGEVFVGKTLFFNAYFKNNLELHLSTIGIDKEISYIKVYNHNYKLTLWDTPGSERFRALPKKYYQNADGILFLFDVTDEISFNNIPKWLEDIKKQLEKEEDINDIILYLIGNKIDKSNRDISKEKAEGFAKSNGMKYFEIYGKINLNIQEIMARLILDYYRKYNPIDNSIEKKLFKYVDY